MPLTNGKKRKRQTPKIIIPPEKVQELLPLARQGDTQAFQRLSLLLEPVVTKLSQKACYATELGREDARSYALLSMMEFLLFEPVRENWYDTPRLLLRAIVLDLKNKIERQHTITRRERHTEDGENEEDATELPHPGSLCDPEEKVLQDERKQKIQECLERLASKQKQVIVAYYYRQLSVEEIAEEMHCSVNSVSLAKNAALKKLRKLFEEKQIRQII